jgi:hypothetical protein
LQHRGVGGFERVIDTAAHGDANIGGGQGGASLMPSPFLATISPLALISMTMRCLSSGRSSARASMPRALAIAAAVRLLSAVSIIADTPRRFRASIPARRRAVRRASQSRRPVGRAPAAPIRFCPHPSTKTPISSAWKIPSSGVVAPNAARSTFGCGSSRSDRRAVGPRGSQTASPSHFVYPGNPKSTANGDISESLGDQAPALL